VAVPGTSPPDPELGDLPWALHNVWLHYRHSMDESVLRDILFPLLRRAMNYYLHFLYVGADGRLHLPPTFSPEYGNAPDCAYDLALIRWSCRTLLSVAPADPLAERWQEVLDTLVDYPVDGNGYMIGAGVPLAKSLHDMLCQSWGDVIRIFPAVPTAWADVTLHDFRTEGAFLVSAVRRGGTTQWVRVRSEAGSPCRVRTGIAGTLAVHGARGWRDLGDGTIELDLGRGEEALVHAAGETPDLTIAPVPVTVPAPRWGLPPVGAARTVAVDLATVFDNVAMSNEFFMGTGDFDGAGRTYPAAQLPQTGQVLSDGIEFRFANGGEGDPNNVVPAGQTVPAPTGRYARLHVLGAGDAGAASGTVTVHYAGGGSAALPVTLPDWLAADSAPVRTAQIHTRTGPLDQPAGAFHQVLALDAGRDVEAVTLAADAGSRPHVFALTLERPS
jgi:hypothetical protein